MNAQKHCLVIVCSGFSSLVLYAFSLAFFADKISFGFREAGICALVEISSSLASALRAMQYEDQFFSPIQSQRIVVF